MEKETLWHTPNFFNVCLNITLIFCKCCKLSVRLRTENIVFVHWIIPTAVLLFRIRTHNVGCIMMVMGGYLAQAARRTCKSIGAVVVLCKIRISTERDWWLVGERMHVRIEDGGDLRRTFSPRFEWGYRCATVGNVGHITTWLRLSTVEFWKLWRIGFDFTVSVVSPACSEKNT